MIVKEVKEKLEQFDESLEIGGCGHFGEILELHSIEIREDSGKKYVKLSIEWAGEEPD